MPERIQRKRTKGWKMSENTISVTRPGKWGNPFIVGQPIPKVWLHMEFDFEDTQKYMNNEKIKDNEEAVRLYKKYAIPNDLSELRNKNIACWCKIGDPCHGDILLKLANQ